MVKSLINDTHILVKMGKLSDSRSFSPQLLEIEIVLPFIQLSLQIIAENLENAMSRVLRNRLGLPPQGQFRQ